MVTLDVEGPLPVPFEPNPLGSKHINSSHGREFFDGFDELADRRGCYVFALRTGGGLRALYVGKATKNFGQEVFAVDKLQKYNTALHTFYNGTPMLLFVLTPPRVTSAKVINEVEKYLIRSAKIVWPDLLNKHHTGPDSWDISGVTVTHPGKRSAPELALARLLDIHDD